MAKTSGGVRTYRQGSSTYRKRQAEVEAMRQIGKSILVWKWGKVAATWLLRKVQHVTSPKNWKRLASLQTRGIK